MRTLTAVSYDRRLDWKVVILCTEENDILWMLQLQDKIFGWEPFYCPIIEPPIIKYN